ncbi:hypothetical protein UlMin_030129 [Ulmus minor]
MDSSNHSYNTIQTPIIGNPSSFYLTQLSIGSKQYSPYLQVDTGASLTWVQCEGCKTCFPLKGGNFKYKESQTNYYLPCNHKLCVPKLCGWVLSDFFAFSTKNLASKVTFRLAFGCGLVNPKMNWGITGTSNVIAGIFGLERGTRSFLDQLQSETKMRFSYCLPSSSIDKGAQTLLHFGVDAEIKGSASTKLQTTKLVMSNKYYVTMLGISIEGKRLKIDPSVFRLKKNAPNGGGFMIDSGSTYSILIKSAYTIFRNEMVQYLKQKNGWIPKPQRDIKFSGFDLCYATPKGKNYSLPSVTYHFGGGADFVMNSYAVFRPLYSILCLGIIGFDGASILGAFQQVNHRFLFDVGLSTVSFVPESPCKYN